jgi:hypothetical protein
MRHVLKIAALAALLGAGALAAPTTASAQGFSVQIGPDRPRVERRDYRDYREPRIIERRIVRPKPRRTVCTTRWEETWTRGRLVRRPVETCRTR